MWTTTKTDLSGWLDEARRALSPVADQPSIEALSLLGGLLGKSRAWIYAHSETVLSPADLSRLAGWVSRRLEGEPLPYLLGKWEFYGLEFFVSPAVLIPRPETELIIDLGREWSKGRPSGARIVDVGTGSGCIAASLAYWIPKATVFAVDVSAQALEMATRNFRLHNLSGRVQPVRADLLAPFRGPFDLIVANLPYIPTAVLQELPVSRHEPRLALDGGPDGLRLIEPLLLQAVSRLANHGRILLEIEMGQGRSAAELATQYFPAARVEVRPDLAGLPRVLIIDT